MNAHQEEETLLANLDLANLLLFSFLWPEPLSKADSTPPKYTQNQDGWN